MLHTCFPAGYLHPVATVRGVALCLSYPPPPPIDFFYRISQLLCRFVLCIFHLSFGLVLKATGPAPRAVQNLWFGAAISALACAILVYKSLPVNGGPALVGHITAFLGGTAIALTDASLNTIRRNSRRKSAGPDRHYPHPVPPERTTHNGMAHPNPDDPGKPGTAPRPKHLG